MPMALAGGFALGTAAKRWPAEASRLASDASMSSFRINESFAACRDAQNCEMPVWMRYETR